MKHLTLILSGLLFFSCSQNKHSSGTAADSTKKALVPQQGTSSAKTYLFEDQKLHAFSDASKLDTFKLKVTGDEGDYQKAKVTFQIISHDGREIYSDTFDGNFLIDYGILQLVDDPVKLTPQMRTDYIRKRLKNFFADENFRSPAIKPDAKFEDHYINRDIFEELKQRPGSVSFFYLLGKEDGRYIAFSPKEQKAILFYNCC